MTLVIIFIVVALFSGVVLRMLFAANGRPGTLDSNNFPYDTGSTIAPPSWSPDSGNDNDSQCEVSDGGWSDGGDCDSGGDGGGGGD